MVLAGLKSLVSVVILNYNTAKLAIECVKSIFRTTTVKDIEVIVLDNGSAPGEYERLEKALGGMKKVVLWRSGKNLGFAGGNNYGVERARGKYVVLLNSDTLVEKGWLEKLLERIRSDQSIALVGSIEWNNPKGQAINLLGHHVPGVFKDEWKENYVGGASCLCEKSVVGKPFDEVYFLYGEDVYLNWRLLLAGKNVFLERGSRIFHHVSKSTGGAGRTFVYFSERNRLLNMLLFYGPWTLARLAPLVLLGIGARLVSKMLRRDETIPYYLEAYSWILTHLGTAMEKRRQIQAGKRVSDHVILKRMTSKVFADTRFLKRLANRLVLVYCIVLGIPCLETSGWDVNRD